MRRASNIPDFFRQPEGAFLAGARYRYWCFDRDLWGVTAWGRPEAHDIRELVSVFRAEHERPILPYDSIADFSQLERIEPEVFRAWLEYVAEYAPRQAARKKREAVIRPLDALVGAALAGYAEIVGPTYPLRVFAEGADAVAWLERADGPQILSMLGQFAATRDCETPLVRLRELLAVDDSPGRIEIAAKMLGMSPRALQRALAVQSTSFQRERRAARIDRAMGLLSASDAKLSAIAQEAGFASQQDFNRVFTRTVGVSPGAFRRGARARR